MKSILTVVTPATSFDLTVLETVKSEFGITNTDQDDNLARYIHEASAAIANVCNRVFAEEVVREEFRRVIWGNRIDNIVLRRKPVTLITSIIEDDVTLVEGTDFEVNSQAGIIYRLWDGLGSRRFWYFYDNIVITYRAGYFLLDDLPYDVERACIRLVRYFYETGGGSSSSSSSSSSGLGNLKVLEVPGVIRKEWETRGNNVWQTIAGSVTLPPDVMALLGPYKVPAFTR